MPRHAWSLVATALAFTLAGCPGKAPTTPIKTTTPGGTTTTASNLASLNGSVTAPAGIVASGAGNIVASGGGNIVASGGGNIVASGAGNRRVLATAGTKLSGTEVILLNAGTLVEVERTKTDAKGFYSFTKAKPGTAYRVLAAGLKDGAPVTLSTMAKAGSKAADIDLASTCCFMACVIKAGNQMNDMDPAKFAAMTEEFAKNLKAGDEPDLSKPANLPHWLGCHFNGTLRSMVSAMVGDMLKQAGLKSQHVLQVPDISGIVNDATKQATQAGQTATQAGQTATQAGQQATEAGQKAVEAGNAAVDYANAQAQELGKSLGLDMAKAAAQLDGCD